MYMHILVSSPRQPSTYTGPSPVTAGGELELARSEEKRLSDQRGHGKSRCCWGLVLLGPGFGREL